MSRSEDEIQQMILMEAPKLRSILLRNNSGALKDVNGRTVRFGLGNISKRVNETFKSSDLIGITSVVITPEMVGQTIGIFTAAEVKKEDWCFNPNDTHEAAQKNFLDFVIKKGGIGFFANNVDTFQANMLHSLNRLLIK
ncbi:MAG: hypothetical protein ACKOX6_12890 [Bdellovibrio sp.]